MAAFTLLQIVQQFCQRKAQPVPTSVIGTTDDQLLQILALLQKECTDLAGRGQWQSLLNEVTFTALGTESQGTISAGLGSGPTALNGFRYMLPEIMWDRTQRIPIVGNLSAQVWAYLKTMGITGPYSQFRWRGDQLLTIPALTAGHTVSFEYITDNIIALHGLAANGSRLFVNDDDTVLLKDDIVLMGLEWRWLAAKGLAYLEDFNTYEDAVKDQLGREKPGRTINLAGGFEGFKPSITIPLMNTIPP